MGMTSVYAEVEPARTEIELIPGSLVIGFGAPWCGYCSAVQPLLQAAFAAYPLIPHIKIEDGKERPLGRLRLATTPGPLRRFVLAHPPGLLFSGRFFGPA